MRASEIKTLGAFGEQSSARLTFDYTGRRTKGRLAFTGMSLRQIYEFVLIGKDYSYWQGSMIA